MLSECEVMGFIPTRDAAAARAFYEGKLGFSVVSEDGFATEVVSGQTHIRLTKMNEFQPAQYTILGWRVADIESEVRQLAVRGVEFQRYSFLEQDELGIWSAPGGARIAWFLDPDGNVLSVSQH